MLRLPKLFFLTLSALLLAFGVNGQSAHGFTIYEDTGKALTPEAALHLYGNNRFTPAPSGRQNIGFTHSIYWLAFSNNRLLPKDSLVLLVGDHHINRIHVFKKGVAGIDQLYTSGDYLAYAHRPLPTTGFYFPVSEPGTYLVRVDKSNESLQLTFGLQSYVSVLQAESRNTSIMGFLTGVIALLIIFGLYLFAISRDKLYLLYILYIASGWLWVLANSGHGFQFIWPTQAWFASKARPIFSFSTIALSLYFMLYYIDAAKQRLLFKSIRLFTTILLAAIVAILCFNQNGYQSSLWLYIQFFIPLFTFSYIVFLLAILGYKSWKGNKLAQFYLMAVLSLMFFAILQLAFYTGNWEGESRLLSHFGMSIGYIIESIILTAGLAYRFNQYKREKENLLLEMNRSQAENTRTLMEAQEAERSQIANQLHDVAGSLLSAAKLNLSSLSEKAYLDGQQVDIRLLRAEEAVTEVSETVRNLSHALSPVMLAQVGIRKSLEKIVTIFNASGKIKVGLVVSGFDEHDIALNNYYTGLYGLIYELLNNIIKHAGAAHALVQVAELDDCFTIIVEDDGIGFDTSKIRQAGSLGLAGVFSKIEYFGGQIAIDKGEPKGTLITIEIPRTLNAVPDYSRR